jgi:hypothetical protein
MADPSAADRGGAAEHHRNARNNDPCNHTAAIFRSAPIYRVVDVEHFSGKHRNQECIPESSYGIHHRRRDRGKILDSK